MNKVILVGLMMVSLLAFAEHSGDEAAVVPPRPRDTSILRHLKSTPSWIPYRRDLNNPDSHLITGTEEGKYYPAPGYDWDEVNTPPKPVNMNVHWVPGWRNQLFPHIIGGEKEGELTLEPGYMWTDEHFKHEWVVGIPHPKWPHLYSADPEGYWLPEPGYAFVDTSKGDYSVKWRPHMKYGGKVEGVMSSDEEGLFVPEFNYHWASGGNEKRPDPHKELRRQLVQRVDNYNQVISRRFIGGAEAVGAAAAAVTLFIGVRDISAQLGRDLDKAAPAIEKAVRDFKEQFSTSRSTPDRASSSSSSSSSGREGYGGHHPHDRDRYGK